MKLATKRNQRKKLKGFKNGRKALLTKLLRKKSLTPKSNRPQILLPKI